MKDSGEYEAHFYEMRYVVIGRDILGENGEDSD